MAYHFAVTMDFRMDRHSARQSQSMQILLYAQISHSETIEQLILSNIAIFKLLLFSSVLAIQNHNSRDKLPD